MRIGLALFPGLCQLDLTGPHEVLVRLPGAQVEVVARTGAPFSAAEALDWGIANRVCKPETLLDEALETARVIAANAPIGVRSAKKALDKATDLDRASGYDFDIAAYNLTISTEDRLEGVRAFNEKRKPVFKGR